METYTWRGAILLQGAALAHTALFSLIQTGIIRHRTQKQKILEKSIVTDGKQTTDITVVGEEAIQKSESTSMIGKEQKKGTTAEIEKLEPKAAVLAQRCEGNDPVAGEKCTIEDTAVAKAEKNRAGVEKQNTENTSTGEKQKTENRAGDEKQRTENRAGAEREETENTAGEEKEETEKSAAGEKQRTENRAGAEREETENTAGEEKEETEKSAAGEKQRTENRAGAEREETENKTGAVKEETEYTARAKKQKTEKRAAAEKEKTEKDIAGAEKQETENRVTVERQKTENSSAAVVVTTSNNIPTIWDILITLTQFMFSAGDTFVQYMIARRMTYISFSRTQMMWIISVKGVIGILRLVPCYIIDKLDLNRTALAAVFTAILGISSMVSVTFSSFSLMMMYGIVYGFSQGKHMHGTRTDLYELF